ncbi:glycosyltransferase [Rahnella sp. NRRL B-41462]|uniref:glycosyltransferase n=1 Tax=Rahnella sp. NRRL B-41462 TaxID=1610579 RepID=UPI000DD49417|nr:glycosyltransferase [Rahnella sp. NRRL B-41462]
MSQYNYAGLVKLALHQIFVTIFTLIKKGFCMKNIALFIAGDENIYFPALVTIESIKKNNPNVFDFFICFDADKLSAYMTKTLKKHNINFIDSKSLSNYGIKEQFQQMKENIWPVEVFYNYALPLYLRDKGYKYSCKSDYDVLCINKYEIDDILPKESAISGWSGIVNLESQGVPNVIIKKLIDNSTIRNKHLDYMNVGFLLFNNEIYSKLNLLEKYKSFYNFLFENCPDAKLLEQIAFCLLLSSLNGSFIKLTEDYNHRVLSTRDTDESLNFDTKNIHYITRCKPWNPLKTGNIKWFASNGGGCIFAYRNIWLEFAENIEGFEKFCSERKLSSLQLIGLQMTTTKILESKIKELRK